MVGVFQLSCVALSKVLSPLGWAVGSPDRRELVEPVSIASALAVRDRGTLPRPPFSKRGGLEAEVTKVPRRS